MNSGSAQEGHLVRARAFHGLRALVESLNGDYIEFLRQAKLQEDPIASNPNRWLFFNDLLTALESGARLLDCPEFGLRLALEQDLEVLGLLADVMQSSDTVGEALGQMTDHFSGHSEGDRVILRIEGDKAILSLREQGMHSAGIVQHSDLVAGVGVTAIRALIGSRWSPDIVYLRRSRPDPDALFRNHFRCTIIYDWDDPILVFPNADLQRRLTASNPHLRSAMERRLLRLKREQEAGVVVATRQAMQAAIPGGNAGIEAIAMALSMHKRTLQRRLRQSNTSYNELLEQTRFDYAKAKLSESDIPLTELSLRLGYAQLSAFSYAFRRHCGQSPSQWRKHSRKKPEAEKNPRPCTNAVAKPANTILWTGRGAPGPGPR